MPSLHVDIQQESGYLIFIVTGQYILEEAVERFPLVLSVCRKTGITKVLIDYRGLGGEPAAALDILYAHGVGGYYKQHLSSGGMPLKIAFVGRESTPWNFGEEIAKEYQLNALTTSDYSEALNWLLDG